MFRQESGAQLQLGVTLLSKKVGFGSQVRCSEAKKPKALSLPLRQRYLHLNHLEVFLKKHNIVYEKHTHATVFTCDEANEHRQGIKGSSSKNLLLQNKKTSFLVIIAAYKQIDLEFFAAEVNKRKISFTASKALYDLLNLTRGSVSPFGLINDTTK